MKHLLFASLFFLASYGFAQQETKKEPVSPLRGQSVHIPTPDSLLDNTNKLYLRGATEYNETPLKQPTTNDNRSDQEKKIVPATRNKQ